MKDLLKYQLYQQIDPDFEVRTRHIHQVTYESFGPNGQLDKHLALLSSEGNSYRHRKILPRNPTKKKIILSDGTFRFRAPSLLELQIISALFDEFEVYTWSEETEKNILICKPLANAEAFWSSRQTELKSATTQQIKRHLSNQGVSTENYVILDHMNYREILNSFTDEKEIKEPRQLDLTQTDEKLDPANYISPSELTSIKLPIRQTRDLEHISEELKDKIAPFYGKNDNWNENHNHFDEYEIDEIGLPEKEKNFYFEPGKKMKFKNLPNCTKLIAREREKKTKTDSLHIENCSSLENIDIKACQGLKELIIRGCASLTKAEIPKGYQLEKLIIEHVSHTFSTSPNFLKLKKLKMFQFTCIDFQKYHGIRTNIAEIKLDMADLTELENLLIKTNICCTLDLKTNEKLRVLNVIPGDGGKIKILNLSGCPNITDLKINQDALQNVDEFHTLLKLESLELCGKKSINLQRCQHLRKLRIANAENLKDFNIGDLNHLEELEIEKCGSVKEIIASLKNFKNLKRLIIRNHADLRLLNLSDLPQLEYLEIDDCPNINIQPQLTKALRTLKISKLAEIKQFECLLKHVESLELTDLRTANLNLDFATSIRSLNIFDRHWSMLHLSLDLNMRAFPNLETLYVLDDNFKDTHLDLTCCPKLKLFNYHAWKGNKNRTFNFTNCKNLEVVDLKLRVGTHLDLNDLPQLREVLLRLEYGDGCGGLGNNITVANCSSLNTFSIDEADERFEAKSLDFLKSNQAEGINLDFSHCTNLTKLNLYRSSKFNIKNLTHCHKLKQVDVNALNSTSIIACLPPTSHRSIEEKLPYEPDPKLLAQHAKLAELFRQLQETQMSSVSCLSENVFSGIFEIDENTARSMDVVEIKGNINVRLDGKTPMPTDQQRVKITDKIAFNEKTEKITIYSQFDPKDCKEKKEEFSSFSEADYQEYIQQAKKNLDINVGCFTGTVGTDYYPLPTDLTMEEDQQFKVHCNPANSIELFWHEEHQQYYFRRKVGTPEKIEIMYVYQKNKTYHGKAAPNELEICDPPTLLPPALIAKLKVALSELKEDHPLFFINSELTILEKVNLLKEYCRFEDSKLSRKTTSQLDTLLAIIFEQKGKCRHSAQAFMILTRLLGVPTRMLQVGDDHATCELPYINKDGAKPRKKWQRCDLGGSPMLKLIKPEYRTQDLKQAQQIKKYVEEKKKDPEIKIERKTSPLEEKYYDFLKSLVAHKPLDSVRSLLDNKFDLAPLIEIKDNQCPFHISQLILNQLSETKDFDAKSQFVFINQPKELDEYLFATQFKNNRKQKVPGPLKEIINPEGKGGVVLINWANFTPAQIASYKSMLDAKPTLSGHPIGAKTTVIGLIKSSTMTSSAFKSRCQRYTPTENFFSNRASDERKMIGVDSLDLFHRLDWREQLFGKIHFSENQIILEEGPLFKAIKSGHTLNIINPPADKDFDELIKRIRCEGKILYNGEMIIVPPDLIQLSETDHKISLDYVKILNQNETKSIDHKQIVYLGLHNLHECFETLIIKNKLAKTLPYGYLQTSQTFYLTETITKADWQLILDAIETINKSLGTSLQYEFILAPGVSIEGVRENETDKPRPLPISALFSTIFTNDPDFYCDTQFCTTDNSTKPFVIHITPSTGFHDLFYKTSWEVKADSSVQFNFEEKNLLTALKQGKQVIISGSISADLYRQLLPMLSSDHPHLMINGERISLKPGQLVVVAPSSSKQCLPLISFSEKNYNLADYENYFAKEDANHFPKINQFFDYAKFLSHNWEGRPSLPTLTFARLKLLIRNLNLAIGETNPLHKHNPIKGLFLYDYIKGSDDYCFLNVVGKLLFSHPDEKAAIRFDKLTPLLAHPEKNLWKILNCFNGRSLQQFFGTQNLAEIMMQSSNGPVLTPSAKQKLTRACRQLTPTLSSRGLSAGSRDLDSDPWIPRTSRGTTGSDQLKTHPNYLVTLDRSRPVLESKTHSESAKKEPHVIKRQKQLEHLLKDRYKPIVFLKGLPGVGKSFTTQQISDQFVFHQGDKLILDMLNQDYARELENKSLIDIESPKTHVHVLDEANMQKPGMWDHLKNFIKRHPSHKILVTGNPEYYAGRYYHSIFQEYGETIYFKMPDEDYLEKEVLAKILTPFKLENESKKILYAFYLIQQMNPQFVYSHRDIENAAQRLILLHKQKSFFPTFYSCVEEFAITIENPTLRNSYINKVASKFAITPPEVKTPEILELTVPDAKSKENKPVYIPKEKFYIVKAIENALQLRQQALKSSHPISYKQGIMLEGEPGLGKSTLFEAILIKYNANPENKPIPYSIISAGDAHAHETLLRAFHRGEIVILDELNIDPSLEFLLNQLLTGKDLNGNSAEKAGFMVLSSQNHSHEKGCSSNSQAIRNRLLWAHVNNNKLESNIAIAKQKFGVFKPTEQAQEAANAYCAAFQKIQTEFPGIANARSFFTGLPHPEIMCIATSAA